MLICNSASISQTLRSKLSESGENAQGLVERLDLILATSNSFFVGHASVNAGWLQFEKLCYGCVQNLGLRTNVTVCTFQLLYSVIVLFRLFISCHLFSASDLPEWVMK